MSPRPFENGNCYMCGRFFEKLEKDHIPPQCFFSKPRPSNLITAPICKGCHDQTDENDQLIRSWIACGASKNPANKSAFERTKMSMEKNPKLKSELVAQMTPFQFGKGKVLLPLIKVGEEKGQKFVIRVVKGLLCNFHPRYNYSGDHFRVTQLFPSPKNKWYLEAFEQGKQFMEYDFRSGPEGAKVFEFWRKIGDPFNEEEGVRGGYWLLTFFGHCNFLAIHQSAPLQTVNSMLV